MRKSTLKSLKRSETPVLRTGKINFLLCFLIKERGMFTSFLNHIIRKVDAHFEKASEYFVLKCSRRHTK